jgi:hypothetical protein
MDDRLDHFIFIVRFLAFAFPILLATWPAHLLPAVIGGVLLVGYPHKALSGLAGLLTLKPLVATPLWVWLYVFSEQHGLLYGAVGPLLTLLPGIGLTLIILGIKRQDLAYAGRLLIIFLVCDALRWINSFLFVLNGEPLVLDYSPADIRGLILPNLYAVMSLVMVFWIEPRLRKTDLTRFPASATHA